jgi:hypothetical protein
LIPWVEGTTKLNKKELSISVKAAGLLKVLYLVYNKFWCKNNNVLDFTSNNI